MGFLSRFRRSAKTLDDIGSIASVEDIPVVLEDKDEGHEVETASIPEHEVESEWESTEMIDSIHLDRDKKSQRLVERKKKSQKPTKKSASAQAFKTRPKTITRAIDRHRSFGREEVQKKNICHAGL